MSLSNVRERVSTSVPDALNAEFNDSDMCLDLPDPPKALDANIASGGFRDFGTGHPGVVVNRTVELNGEGVISIPETLPEPGGDECDCK